MNKINNKNVRIQIHYQKCGSNGGYDKKLCNKMASDYTRISIGI
jgi:hypothetical protein